VSRTARPSVRGTDVLVLGSGIAGLFYAVKAASHGRVVIITKKEDTEANTNYAQGGIAAVVDPADSFDAHVADTLATGAGLCHPDVVEMVVRSGPRCVGELIELGVGFSYEDGQLSLAREGGHSARRIVRAADATGRAIEEGLLRAAARAGVEILEHVFALDLWVHEGRCVGAIAVDREGRETVAFRAPATMLATGGCGQVYRYTTNPAIATGDGLAMAFRAGAGLANLEFVQFHPTALWPVEPRPFLISEAVRGEGAILRNTERAAFMADYDAAADLAPRDIVARAIDAEMKRVGSEHVWLDCSPIDPQRFATRFPTILATCLARGLDPPGEWLPVVPAAHYMCGGVRTDIGARTDVPGLLAAGEVAHTGVHGANRLASNSLLEAVVFAERAADSTPDLLSEPLRAVEPPVRVAGTASDSGFAELRRALRAAMWEGAGIVRSDESLALAARRIEELAVRAPRSSGDPAAAETANLMLIARLVVAAASLRKESRGLHFTLSHPNPDPAFQRDTTLLPHQLKEYATWIA
jgi:L-aspartate oxidase